MKTGIETDLIKIEHLSFSYENGIEVIHDLNLRAKKGESIGLIGANAVGKSTFLSRVSNARPEIANYHFTTLNPHLGVVDVDDINGFVIADIPGLIEGAAEGVGLGHDFLRHIERTKVMIHIVDAASVEGRDPIDDIYAINDELKKYDETLLNRPQVIAANKLDCLDEESRELVINKLKKEFEPKGYKVYPISAISGEGIKPLLYEVLHILETTDREAVVFESEYEIKRTDDNNDPYTVSYDYKEKIYIVEGPKIEKMLGYTNLESEKGYIFFQNFMRDNGVFKALEDLGIQEGDTVQLYGHAFEYFK